MVLDLGLPQLDGLSVLKKWRAAGRSMPVLILTERPDSPLVVSALREGAYSSDGVYEVEGTLTSPVLPGFELVLRDVFTAPK